MINPAQQLVSGTEGQCLPGQFRCAIRRGIHRRRRRAAGCSAVSQRASVGHVDAGSDADLLEPTAKAELNDLPPSTRVHTGPRSGDLRALDRSRTDSISSLLVDAGRRAD
jgi:hypothetical protein